MKLSSSFKLAGSLALLCGSLLTVSAPAQAVAIAGGSTFSTAGNVLVPVGGSLLFPTASAFSNGPFAPVGSYGVTLLTTGSGSFSSLIGSNLSIQSLAFGFQPVPNFLLFPNFSTYTNVSYSPTTLVFNTATAATGQSVTVTFDGTLSYLDGGVAVSQQLSGLVTTQFAGGNQITTYSSSFVIADIPEPSPLVGVLALGMLGGIVVAYNRRKQVASTL